MTMALEDELDQALEKAERFALGAEPPAGDVLSLGPDDPRRRLLAEARVQVLVDFVRRVAQELDKQGSVGGGNGARRP
jgi:hypothetical protein